MDERKEGELWTVWARRQLQTKEDELALSREAWEAKFGMHHPGPGYTKTLQAGVDYYTRTIARMLKYKEGQL